MVINKLNLGRISKNQLDKVGEILKQSKKGNSEYIEAVNKLNEYRRLFDIPLAHLNNLMRKRMKKLGAEKNKYILAQRLKRFPSIINKLQNISKGTSSMQLSSMQDIGGIRIITTSIGNALIVKDVMSELKFTKHELKKEKNYIFEPSIDGYRGIHLIYKYGSSDEVYNGLLIELQIRTQLQHIRAMAVETFTMFGGEGGIKFRQGNQEIIDYFDLVADGFAILEKGIVSQKRKDIKKEDIFIQIRQKTKELNIIDKLVGFAKIYKVIKDKTKQKSNKYAIYINTKTHSININIYNDSLFEEFTQQEGNSDIISLIVSAKDMMELARAYPSYYADTGLFIQQLNIIANLDIASIIKNNQ